MSSRSYQSIGDVLSTLREEFPDVTISKIRFLESQGLVNPQRSPSGYRKFFPQDVERLRWVLRQQREHFLPLRVIKERMEEVFAEGAPNQPTPAPVPKPVDRSAQLQRVASVVAALQEGPDLGERTPPPAPPRSSGDQASPEPPRAPISEPKEVPPMDQTPTPAGAVNLDELMALTGLSRTDVEQAEAQGLFEATNVAGESLYGDDAQAVAKIVGQLRRYNLEPRHLRPYRNAVDREISLIEQVVTPLLRARTPEARQKAAEHAAELAKLGQGLRAALLRRELARLLGS